MLLINSSEVADPPMPLSADPTKRPSVETLPKGLRARLLPDLHSTKGAVWVRVHAGSHDAPEAYPGLAHFLEHLFFLGSVNYPVQDSLMPFVQGCGGQLNASTCERHTDFFCQVPAARLEGVVLRLLDMLAHPLLDPEAQRREREVVHAEFLARGQDAETLRDAALGRAFATHPFGGFHAGKRETLPVEDAAFQEALIGYHRRFYQSGQIELLLAGPQGRTELRQLAERADALLPEGEWVARKSPPLIAWAIGALPQRSAPDTPALKRSQPRPLPQEGIVLHAEGESHLDCELSDRETWLRLQLDNSQPTLSLAFALDELPEACAAALHYLETWISSRAEGGLLQRLRGAGFCDSLELRVPYWHDTQGVLVIETRLTDQGMQERDQVIEAVLGWLRFFSSDAAWQACSEEYRRIVRCSLHGAQPLALLRHWVEPKTWFDGDEVSRRQALHVLLEQMLTTGPLVMTATNHVCSPVEHLGFPLRMAFEPPVQSRAPSRHWDWQPPALNPWLKPSRIEAESAPLNPALKWQGSEHPAGQGAVFLRWRFKQCRPSAAHWHAVVDAMQPKVWAAQQAGVALRLDDMGDSWTLRLCGRADPIPAILSGICVLLARVPDESLVAGAALAERARSPGNSEMLIRQLLARFPAVLSTAAVPAEMDIDDRSAQSAPFRSAVWDGLVIGLPEEVRGSLGSAIRSIPGTPSVTLGGVPPALMGRHWRGLKGDVSAETAVLLFCPLSMRDAACEAAWRVLGAMIESAFFRRLRSELQLGYAVFSRFHQVGQYMGLLFGVQSPTASSDAIQRHIQAFLDGFETTLAGYDATALSEKAHDMSRQHLANSVDFQTYADQAWQTQLTGHDANRPEQVAEAMRALTPEDLLDALNDVRHGAGGWIVFSNAVDAGSDARGSCSSQS